MGTAVGTAALLADPGDAVVHFIVLKLTVFARVRATYHRRARGPCAGHNESVRQTLGSHSRSFALCILKEIKKYFVRLKNA